MQHTLSWPEQAGEVSGGCIHTWNLGESEGETEGASCEAATGAQPGRSVRLLWQSYDGAAKETEWVSEPQAEARS